MAAYDSLHFELGVRNLQALAANFHAADEALQADIRVLVAETSEDVRALAFMLAPKRTGFLSEHITAWITASGLGFEVGWNANDFIEAGLAFYPWFVEFGTINMAAQPSVGPAFDTIRPTFEADMTKLLRAAVARIGAG